MANRVERHHSDHAPSPDQEVMKPAGRRPRARAAATVGRRGQRGKRRGQKERRRGQEEKGRGNGETGRGQKDKGRGKEAKGRGQEEKRRGQEEKTEGVTVKRTWNDGKRRWDKKHYCAFCRRPQVKIARHLLRKHADQQEVLAASTLPTGSKERHLLLEHLRCRGNYMHNIEVIRQGRGEIVPWRQPSEEVDARNYLPCPLCLGFFLRADLWKHQASCRKKLTPDPSAAVETTSDPPGGLARDPAESTEDTPPVPPGDATAAERTETSETGTKRPLTSDPGVDQNATSDPGVDQNVTSDPTDPPRKRSRVQAAASRLLPISSGASESCSEVLHRMNQDYVSHQVKSDWLICKYGNKLMGNQDGGHRRYDYVSQKLRELGRFLLAAKSLDSGIQTLQDLLAPGRLSLALAAARKASGYRWSRPPLAVKTTLKTVCEIAIGENLQDGDWEAAAKTTDFYHLLGREWDNLGLLNPDPDAAPVEGAQLKKRSVQSKSEKSEEPSDLRPQGPPQSLNRPLNSMTPPESRLQTPITGPVAPRKVRRRPWSSAEKEAVWRQLGVHVLVQSVPGKEVCQRCLDLEPVLRGRHWKDIKNQVHNQIQSQKKQQFHAQMDLQESQEQQDQIQNQKKQQQYQAPVDQEGKDNAQNQKKQQYQVQMGHQDQDSMKNHKKQQYQTPLDHQDHLQIHKKQLCHGRLDHQDHLQIHLQTPLPRDSSVLSYGPEGPYQASGPPLLERDPPIGPYPLPPRTMGPHMDQLLSRAEWADESLVHYAASRHLDRNLMQDDPGPPNPHPGHAPF